MSSEQKPAQSSAEEQDFSSQPLAAEEKLVAEEKAEPQPSAELEPQEVQDLETPADQDQAELSAETEEVAAADQASEAQEGDQAQEGQPESLAADSEPDQGTADLEQDTASQQEPAEPVKTLKEIKAEELAQINAAASAHSLLFYSPDLEAIKAQMKAEEEARRAAEEAERRERRLADLDPEITSHRRRRRRRGDADLEFEGGAEGDPEDTIVKVRAPRLSDSHGTNRVTGVRGSTRLEAKKIRRRETRATGRRRQIITEAEFLARRESVDRQMLVRQKDDRIQIGVLEDGVLAEHFVSKTQQDSLIGNVYLGKVQNVLPSMEAAFVDIGRGRNAVLYAGEVNWDVTGLDGAPRKIENALKAGDSVLVQVTKDPIGHKGARLTSQVSLPGRYLVYVPGGSMTGISRKLPDVERQRLKKILKDKLPEDAGVIVRTAAEGASEEELTNDVNRLRVQWEEIKEKSESKKVLAPELLYQEPDLTIKTVRDVFNEDFTSMVVQGQEAWDSIEAYVTYVAPDLHDRLKLWQEDEDLFDHFRIEEQLAKALDRKVYLPSGGSLVIDRTEAMTVVDVNTGKFTGSGGNLEETVTKNNLEAAEEIVRQLRLRDIGGIVVIDFIDMVLESNRELVLRRLVECLGRDRTKHQVAEVTSLGLVQMTRKRMGTGLLEVFSEPCETCAGRGLLVHDQPLKSRFTGTSDFIHRAERDDRKRYRQQRVLESRSNLALDQEKEEQTEARKAALANIVAASSAADSAEQEGESKSARKRRRRKRNRRAEAGMDLAQENLLQPVEGQTSDGGEVLTIGQEVIELPRSTSLEAEEGLGEQGSFTLESLAAVFEAESRKAAPSAKKAQRSADQFSADELTLNSDAASDIDPELDSRFTQNSSRLEAIRAGEARARASQRAGREFAPREGGDAPAADRPARSSGRGRKVQADQEQLAPARTRRPRRASSSEPKYQDPLQVEADPNLTGLARPGTKADQLEKPQKAGADLSDQQGSDQLAAGQQAGRKKRRSRRAVSLGAGSSQVVRQEPTAASGSSIRATVEQATQEAEPAGPGPVMLGVGVAAADIKRLDS